MVVLNQGLHDCSEGHGRMPIRKVSNHSVLSTPILFQVGKEIKRSGLGVQPKSVAASSASAALLDFREGKT